MGFIEIKRTIMEIESRVISIETITPSSPTPKSLQKYQLSFLDQGIYPSFIQFVYFYSPNPIISNSEKSKQLKKSLSEVLSIYYPLAGRIVGNLYVDCNDAGIPFSEAEADCDLSHSQVITTQNPTNLKKFLPFTTYDHLCLAVRATYFRCSGLAVGISLAHKIADGLSFVLLVNTWSALARDGCGGMSLPKFDTATYAPPLDILNNFRPSTRFTEEEVAARIFTLSALEIAALQKKKVHLGRALSLEAFIWSLYRDTRSDPGQICVVGNAVNLRSRGDPPLSEYQFGNFIRSTRVEAEAGDSCVELIWKLRDATKAFDAGFLARMKNREVQLEYIKAQPGVIEGTMAAFFFSSMCRFPFYEADFGWGGADRVMNGGSPFKNIACFMDTRSEGGIDILIQLTKPDMVKFEARLMLSGICND